MWVVSTSVDKELVLSFRPGNQSSDRRTSEDPYNVVVVVAVVAAVVVLCSSSSAQEEDKATGCGRTVALVLKEEPTDPYCPASWASTSPVFGPLRRDSSELVHAQRWFAGLGGRPNPRAVDWRCTRRWVREELC